MNEPGAKLGRRMDGLARDLDVRDLELSRRRRAGSSSRVNDHIGPGGGAHQLGCDKGSGDQLDPIGHGAPAAGPYDGLHLPSGAAQVTHDVLADEPVGARHGDPTSHRSALPVQHAAARLAP